MNCNAVVVCLLICLWISTCSEWFETLWDWFCDTFFETFGICCQQALNSVLVAFVLFRMRLNILSMCLCRQVYLTRIRLLKLRYFALVKLLQTRYFFSIMFLQFRYFLLTHKR